MMIISTPGDDLDNASSQFSVSRAASRDAQRCTTTSEWPCWLAETETLEIEIDSEHNPGYKNKGGAHLSGGGNPGCRHSFNFLKIELKSELSFPLNSTFDILTLLY